ncbi:MAG: alpha/beta hydrolase [Actinomycetota bacterium]|nr:alpha/beta hydrolase [Actinomycetota bacterium]
MSDLEVVGTVDVAAGDWSFTADVGGPADGELVLFLHGFPQSRYSWRHEIAALAARGYQVCAPDQRGYSAGARPAGVDAYRLEHLVDDVLAIARARGHERFHLVGHDWGGQVAWVVAARHPKAVRSLTIVSRPHPAAFLEAMRDDAAQASRSGHHRSFLRPEATDELLADGAAALRDLYRRSHVAEADADAYLELLGGRDALDAAVNWYRAVRRSPVAAEPVGAITCPVLYVWGTDDATVGRVAASATGAHVEGRYRFVELPGVGHFVTDEVPGALTPLLIDHLASVPVSTPAP